MTVAQIIEDLTARLATGNLAPDNQAVIETDRGVYAIRGIEGVDMDAGRAVALVAAQLLLYGDD